MYYNPLFTVHRLQLLLLHACALLQFVLPAASEDEGEKFLVTGIHHVSGQQQQSYAWYVTLDTLKKQTPWDGISTNPQYEAKQAAAVALERAARKFPEIEGWMVQYIALHNLATNSKLADKPACQNIWYYKVSVMPKDPKVRDAFWDTGKDNDLVQVILLDGTVLVPVKKQGIGNKVQTW